MRGHNAEALLSVGGLASLSGRAMRSIGHTVQNLVTSVTEPVAQSVDNNTENAVNRLDELKQGTSVGQSPVGNALLTLAQHGQRLSGALQEAAVRTAGALGDAVATVMVAEGNVLANPLGGVAAVSPELGKQLSGSTPPPEVMGDLAKAINPQGKPGSRLGELVSNPQDVNDVTTPEQDARATQASEAALPYESAWFSDLSAKDQERYAQVRANVQKDPIALASLQSLALSGKLTDSKDLLHGESTLHHLSALTAPGTQVAPGLKADGLTRSVVKELANPPAIHQGPRGTCVPTAMVMTLAQRSPAEYTRIVGGLAQPSGKVLLKGGREIVRSAGTEQRDDTGRTLSQRLLGPALMEVANQRQIYNDAAYDSAGNLKTGPDGKPLEDGAGATGLGSQLLMSEIYGEDAKVLLDFGKNKDEMMGFLATALGDGRPVTVGLDMTNSIDGHAVVPLAVEPDPANPSQSTVRYLNPWGQEERMNEEEFKSRMNKVIAIEPSSAKPPPPPEPPSTSARLYSWLTA